MLHRIAEPRVEEVSAVAVCDLDNVAGQAETRDLRVKMSFTIWSPQRAVEVYGNSAISRAFLTALAISAAAGR